MFIQLKFYKRISEMFRLLIHCYNTCTTWFWISLDLLCIFEGRRIIFQIVELHNLVVCFFERKRKYYMTIHCWGIIIYQYIIIHDRITNKRHSNTCVQIWLKSNMLLYYFMSQFKTSEEYLHKKVNQIQI